MNVVSTGSRFASYFALTFGAGLLVLFGTSRVNAQSQDFDGLADGLQLTNQLEASQGVSFPDTVEVMATLESRTAPNVVVAEFAGEFQREPFEILFSEGQTEVVLYVRRELNTDDPTTIRGFSFTGGGGVLLDQQMVTLTTDSWVRLSVSDPQGRIRLVDVSSTFGIHPYNFFMVDDLSFSTSLFTDGFESGDLLNWSSSAP